MPWANRGFSELLDSLFRGLNASDIATVTVVGHTSSEGSDKYNEQLLQRRAEAVIAALIDHGISPNRVSAQGRGEKEPIADNSTGAGRVLNRRVEILCN